jgi:predicted nucleic acid-binding protein
VSQLSVLYDACVIYPMPLCDLLMQLAITKIYRARWSDDVHEEWMRTCRKLRPDIREDLLKRKRQLMDESVPDALVSNYNELIPSLELPDQNDRHILAAAIVGEANLIVTYNVKDFPQNKLEQWGIEAQHPDDFIADLLYLHKATVCWAITTIRKRLINPSYTIEKYLQILEKLGLHKTVAGLMKYSDIL